MSLNYYAPRTCYELIKDEAGRDSQKTGLLSSYRECPAYVLLGQPGSGKTTAFAHEATQPDCQYVTARDFITFHIKQEWQNKTLFIDGLDEVRAGRSNTLASFDEIRRKLDKLERPFRLSCREADWYGASDREELAKVSPDGAIHELFLVDLKDEDMLEILVKNYRKTEAGASSFLEQARHRELTDLIKNPQALEMLVTAVAEGTAWPENKSDVFKLACEKLLLVEWNKTHNNANLNKGLPTEELIQAAGMLCAVMLLARKDGFALSQSEASENYPRLADMATDHMEHLELISKTRLFSTHEGHTEYSHRIFAEYLSAYYLSNKIIKKDLPVGRVLALMTGNDGGVVAELRGVYAWLTTLCHTDRAMLMQRDPLGVVLYGDVSLFSKEARLKLMHVLSSHAETKGGSGIDYRRNTRSFGAFCQADIEWDFRSILESTGRGERHQYLVEYVLLSMTHGKDLPGLSGVLASLLKDSDCWLRNRRQALNVLVRFNQEQVLREILVDVHRNVIRDPDDDLLGKLLRSMYPARIQPDEIFNYYRPPRKPDYIGAYDCFWGVELTELSAIGQVPHLLDALVAKRTAREREPDEYTYRTMVGKLLVKGVDAFGTSVETERLSSWLGLGLDEHDSILLLHEDAENIRKWLEQFPQVQKNLVERQLEKCNETENFGWCTHKIREQLFNANVPEDYGRWCLDNAIVSENENIRRYFFTEGVATLVLGKGNAGMSLDLVEAAVAKHSRLKQYWDVNRVREIHPEYTRASRERIRHRGEQDRARSAFLQFIRNNLREIEAGTAIPGIFSKLGSAYYGYFIESTGDTPKERLNHFFSNDPEITQSVLVGLRRFIYREDIPNMTEIFRVHMENKYLVYSHPYRGGMDELAKSGPQTLLELNEDKIVKALAFYYVDGTGEEPVWYQTLLNERLELVARVYVEYGTMALRAGKKHLTGSYSLAFRENHRQVARLAALPLLDSFPARCVSERLMPLYDLLAAALLYADRISLQRLVEKKLSLKSMDVPQRVLWLTAGLILDPKLFMQRLTEFVSGKEARINCLSGFLSYRGDQWSPVERLPLQAVVVLTRLIGPLYAPVMITDDDYASGSASFASSEVIIELISRLGRFLTDEATDALEALLQSDGLSKWHLRLRQTLHAQRSAKRETMFKHAGLEQIRDALKNGPPANVADLSCITREHIRELAKRIKYGNTNDFRQYWDKDLKERLDEETCRDRFLSDLRPLLENMQIDAQPEPRYADERRADIRVSFGGITGYNVPIEIKCNDSNDLWHGIRKQLIERYTIDPGAHGYGIYLVFWFGYDETKPHPESGPKPRTPAELEERLSQLLKNDEERKKISVCVVDCTAND